MQKNTWIRFALLTCVALVVTAWTVAPESNFADTHEFTTVQEDTRQFIFWERTLRLTKEQEAVKKEALEAIPAPCCNDNSAYTCCCPCNLSRTIWGMSAFLIAEEGADAETVRAKAQEWIQFVNPDGFSGNSCYSGGCGRPFHKNGCGGMSPSNLVF